MTLADTREGIAATFTVLSEKTGVPIDTAAVVSRLGPPLEMELANWFPAEEVHAVAEMYRGYYGDIAVPATVAMPGAAEAVAAVRSAGGKTVVVTAKSQRHAEATVRALGLEVDEVVGSLFGAAKGTALLRHGADTYVGDHVADVDAARAARCAQRGRRHRSLRRGGASGLRSRYRVARFAGFPGDFDRTDQPGPTIEAITWMRPVRTRASNEVTCAQWQGQVV